jgi:DNA-binding GntR family transcriptional regulator
MSSIRRESLTDHVHRYLLARLASRGVPIGAHLNALPIAEELSVSRTTVNKAIARLVESGLVRPDGGRRPVLVAYPIAARGRQEDAGSAAFHFANQTEQTYEAILERILQGDFRPGEALKERRLAKELGVNPVTTHRAAERLCGDGLLVRLRRRGWQVVSPRRDDVREIYRIRLLLEPTAFAQAVIRVSEATLDALERETDRLSELGERSSIYDRRRTDYRFHRALLDASGNRVLTETLDPLVRKAHLITHVKFRKSSVVRSLAEHKAILEALRRRDPRATAKQLRAHLRAALKHNIEVWDDRES